VFPHQQIAWFDLQGAVECVKSFSVVSKRGRGKARRGKTRKVVVLSTTTFLRSFKLWLFP
jgi:hypothetical protein